MSQAKSNFRKQDFLQRFTKIMSINDQLAAYRAKKAAQKEKESKDKSSIFTKTFSVLRSRGKNKEGGQQGMTQTQSREDSSHSHTEKLQKNDGDVTRPPTSDKVPHRDDTSPNSDSVSPHKDLLTPNAGPRHGFLSCFLLHDGRLLNGPRVLKGLLWLILWGLFIELQFGCVFFIVSLFYFVYTSMESGTRDKAQPSAYSVFNENCERIDGTFTTEQFEKELRYGAMSVH